VRFDLHDDAHPIADVDRTRVFSPAAREDVGAFAGKLTEERLRVFVAAMLAPERAEEAKLNFVRFAAKALYDEFILVAAEGDDIQDGLVYGHDLRIRGA
jgi:hypothetical protein